MSSSIVLNEFVPPLRDRLTEVVSEVLREHLMPLRSVEKPTLEIEAKLGRVIPIVKKKDPLYSLFTLPQTPYILPELKGAYRFEPGLDDKTFYMLLDLFYLEVEKRPTEVRGPEEQETVDRFYGDVRVTYNEANEV